MKKKLFPILIIAAILLGACSKTEDASQITEPVGEEVVGPADENTAPQDGPFTDEKEPCKPFSFMDQEFFAPVSELPPVTEDDLVVGPDDAAVTFIEYSQLTCPACGGFEPMMTAIRERYPDDVRIVYRHFPFQDKSVVAAQALEAAEKQGKFSEFKDYMFERRAKSGEDPELANLPDDAFWGSVPEKDLDEWLEKYVVELGLEPTQFLEDMYSPEIVEKVQAALNSAQSLGINATPTLFFNGFKWLNNENMPPQTIDQFSIFIQLVKNQEIEYDVCPPFVTQTDKNYSATINTTKGDIIVDLFADIAPYAVNSFVFLAQEGWYDGLPFIATDDFVLSGDPSDTGSGGAGYIYLDELNAEYSLTDIGMLVTYNNMAGTNGSTFFINKTSLENQQDRTIFGEVTEGMDVVNALELRENIFNPVIDLVLTVTINEN